MPNVLGLAALALTLVLSTGSQAVAVFDDASLIAEVRSGWQEAMNARDLFGMLDWYAPGAVVLPAEAAPRLGAEQIADWHGRWLFHANVYYAFETRSLSVDGRWALEEWEAEITLTPRGDGKMAIGGDPLQFRQSGFRVYRKDRIGRWRIDREVWSDDLPAVRELQRF
ncbi:MAG: nuclear transport factor 2 family protein [Acidobacteria bacterium]|nr:nuclear transport factor 2 family protein [Acidobacteriota bacterium]